MNLYEIFFFSNIEKSLKGEIHTYFSPFICNSQIRQNLGTRGSFFDFKKSCRQGD
jgi:hypothetical protein